MAPTGPYEVNDKYYMIVRLITPRALSDLDNPLIHTGFFLYPTSFNNVQTTYDHLSIQKRLDYTYVHAFTPDRDSAGNLFSLIAGIPTMPRETVHISYWVAAGGDASEQQERKKEVSEKDLLRVVKDYISRDLGGEEVEVFGYIKEGKVRFRQENELSVRFGVLEVDVKYSNPIGDTRPAPGSG
jgi:hypothetical protein